MDNRRHPSFLNRDDFEALAALLTDAASAA
jgi:hypothetical protein